jgi:hypothetical protein
MSQVVNLPLKAAEIQVQKSRRELEETLDNLAYKIDSGVKTAEKLREKARNPIFLAVVVTVIGVFLGRSYRLTRDQK